jgi:glycosyltransferase involved in cell wall biosynthesis
MERIFSILNKPEISFVIPVFNEEETLRTLYEQVCGVMEKQSDLSFEIIFINDGSTDGSWKVLSALVNEDSRIQVIKLRRNFGKSSALSTGFEHSRGDILITMDADLQDDPTEVPRFLEKIDEGFDLVTGWKEERHDPLSKTMPSKIFNSVTAIVSGLKLKDFNCGFKAGRREVFLSIQVYGELHRYIPVLAHHYGFSICEIPINHRPREFGKSKYGFERYVRGFLDLLTVTIITRYGGRPGHLFGGIGVLTGIAGGGILAYLTLLRLGLDQSIGDRPLLILGVMLMVLSVQLLLFGMLAELILNRTDPSSKATLVSELLVADEVSDGQSKSDNSD